MAAPPLPPSKSQIDKAGEILASKITEPRSLAEKEQAARVFRLAHEWRNSHQPPMHLLRAELLGRVRRVRAQAVTAARVKRMASIRRKLARITTTLTQIDDLGGCRAIVASMEELNALLADYRNRPNLHLLRRDRSYIDSPKVGGYRSHHLVFEYRGGDVAERLYDGRRIEVQLRTQLQHSWATAVEAVGMVRGEDMKGGEGDPRWLRLFELVASEIALTEGAAPVPKTPSPSARRREIAGLNLELDAAATLDNWTLAIKQTEATVAKDSKYFIIQYDNASQAVSVRGWSNSMSLADDYSRAERSQGVAVTTVLVEVDRVESLRAAYPNYFLDVSLFARNLRRILEGYPLFRTPEEGQASPSLPRKAGLVDLTWWYNRASRLRREADDR